MRSTIKGVKIILIIVRRPRVKLFQKAIKLNGSEEPVLGILVRLFPLQQKLPKIYLIAQ